MAPKQGAGAAISAGAGDAGGAGSRTAALLGHRRQAHRDIRGAVAGVAIAALQDLEEEAAFERLGVDVEQLATFAR